MKKYLSIIISAVMIMSMMSVPMIVSADTDTESSPEILLNHTFDGAEDSWDTLEWKEARPTNNVTKVISAIPTDDNESNEAMKLTINETEAKSNSKWYHDIDTSKQGDGGVYVLGFDAYISSLTPEAGFSVQLNKETESGAGKTGQIILSNYFNTTNGISFNVGAETPYKEKTAADKWHHYEIVYNSITRRAALYFDNGDTPVIDFDTATGNPALVDTVGSISFVLDVDNSIGDSVYFDNILLTWQSATAYDAANTLPKTETLPYVEGKDLDLPTTGLTGSTITWSSDMPSVIDPTTGVVTPSTEGEKTVKLTATVTDTVDATGVTKEYTVTVPKGVPDDVYAQEAADAIVVPDYVGQEMLDLPIAGTVNGSTIVWSSNNPNVMNVVDENKWYRAYVTVPENKTEVTLTAAVTYKDAKVNKTFTYVIYGKDTPLEEDFALNGYSGDINGYNGWTESIGSTNNGEKTSARVDENGTLIVEQAKYTNDDQRASHTFTKKFRQVAGGIAEISLDAVFGENSRTTGDGFSVECDGVQLNVQKTRVKVTAGDTDTGYISGTAGEGNNCSIVMKLNYYTMTADFIVNGKKVCSGLDISASSRGIADSVAITPIRTNGKDGAEFTLTFDNVNVKSIAPEIQIADIRFTDGDGNAVIGKTDGGLVKGVTVSTNEDVTESVQIFATVSDSEGKISSVAMGSAANLTKDKAVEVTFSKGAQLPAENAADAVVSLYAMDSLNNLIPLTSGKLNYNGASDGTVQFFMCGDSIMDDYTDMMYGVGMVIGDYFSDDKVSVTNLGSSGASTKTFYEEKYELQNNLGSIKNGDYVFLMFGHNDSAAAAKGTDETYYKLYLTKMINMARTKGAIPVLMSPVVRYKTTDDVKETANEVEGDTLDNSALEEYTLYMEELAEALNVKYIDVNQMTYDLIQTTYGVQSEAARAFYLLDKNNDGKYDTTHLSEKGARDVAQLIAKEIKAKGWLPEGYCTVE